ncbi:hypothetical protein Tco_0690153, partial [Tanacetum coccineum]
FYMFHAVVNQTNVDYAALLWWDFINNVFHKKEAIQYPHFIKLIIADMMKKFPNISKRLEEDYHSIKDDVPLRLERRMILRRTHRITPSAHRSPIVFASPPETKKRKQIAREFSSSRKSLKLTMKQKEIVDAKKNDADYEDRLELGSHKDNLEVIDDDDDNAREKKDDTMGRIDGYCALRRMCRRQSYMIQDMERKCVTTEKFWETHNKVDQVLKEVILEIAKNAVNDLIEYNLKPCIAETIIEDRDAFRSDITAFDRPDNITLWEALRRKFEKSSTSNTSCREDDFHSHHDEHQDDDAPLKGEKRVKRSKKSKRSKSAREENVVDEDEVIPEDVTPELIVESQNVDKRVLTIFDHARMEATLRDSLSNLSRNAKEYAYHLEQSTNLFFLKYGNTEEKKYILSLHKIHVEEFPEPDLEEKLNRWVRKKFKTFNEDARITKVVRIVTDQPHGLDFMEQILVMRANNKPNSFSEADFKYLNKNDIEDLYYLCRIKEIDNHKINLMNSLITFIRSCMIWERVHDFQLGIKSYQMKVNLTTPTLTFPGIEEHAPYTIVDEPQMGLIYLNSKDEKRVMYLEEIVKFCDATLEKVLNEVKLRMFESNFSKETTSAR